MDTNNIPILFNKKAGCCGCGACINICPLKIISMEEDEYGFLYPVINERKCIRCGRCISVCAFQNRKEENHPLQTFAAVAKDKNILKNSASGGIFTVLAEKIITNNGAVFGVAFDNNWGVHHIKIEEKSEICKLQGSKYIQSSTEKTYNEVKNILNTDREVLYSGTPCQIAGLYSYLGKTYKNLYTVDLICHGVPSNKMFKDYIKLLERQDGKEVKKFIFRDKTIGWGLDGKIVFKNGKKNSTKKLWKNTSSYIFYFSEGWLYRESCYQCKYASSNRPADLTLGDFWGIEKMHPDYIGNSNWDESKGISVVIVNTDKGKKILRSIANKIELRISDFGKASVANVQLRKPSSYGRRDEILELYKQGGWETLEKQFRKDIGIKRYLSQIKAILPKRIKIKLKQLYWHLK